MAAAVYTRSRMKLEDAYENQSKFIAKSSRFSIFKEFCKGYFAKFQDKYVFVNRMMDNGKIYVCWYEQEANVRFARVVDKEALVPLLSNGDLVFVFDKDNKCYILTEANEVAEDADCLTFRVSKLLNPDKSSLETDESFYFNVNKKNAFEEVLILHRDPEELLPIIARLAKNIPSPDRSGRTITAYKFERMS
jgi:hypothetical protein